MKTDKLPTSPFRRLSVVLVLVVLLSACQPDYGPPKITDIALDSDGIAVPINTGEDPTSEPAEHDVASLTEQGTASERCVANNECIRLVDEHTIEETTDGWETSEVVWQFSPTDSWLNHEYGGAYAPEVGLFDIVEAQDGTVVVAGGQLGIITRSPDGVWTPSVAEFRTLPLGLAGWLLTQALMISLAVWIGFGRKNYGSGPAKAALGFLTPMFVLTGVQLYGTSGLALSVLLLLTVPIFGAGVSTLIGAGIRMWRSPNIATAAPVAFAGLLALLAAGWSGLYVLWSRDFVSWDVAVPLTVAFLIAVFVAGAMTTRTLPAKPWTTEDLFVLENPYTAGQVVGRSIAYLAVAFVCSALGVVSGGLFLILVLVPFVAIGLMVAKLPYELSDLAGEVADRPELVPAGTSR